MNSSVFLFLLGLTAVVNIDGTSRREASRSNDRMLRTNRIVDAKQLVNEWEDLSADVDDCTDLSGTWNNQHGSELIIKNDTLRGVIAGQYRSAVESSDGSAGSSFSRMLGATRGNLLTFHVFWNRGESVTTWTGQCHTSCDSVGRPVAVIQTSWILTSAVNTCEDNWLSNRFGQDIFTRGDGVTGFRRARLHEPRQRN